MVYDGCIVRPWDLRGIIYVYFLYSDSVNKVKRR